MQPLRHCPHRRFIFMLPRPLDGSTWYTVKNITAVKRVAEACTIIRAAYYVCNTVGHIYQHDKAQIFKQVQAAVILHRFKRYEALHGNFHIRTVVALLLYFFQCLSRYR